MASPGGKLSSAARLMRNGETERFSMQFVKKVRFEKLYVLICLRPISENVAVPHPPLRGTFPPGEGIAPANSNLSLCLRKPIACFGIISKSSRRDTTIVNCQLSIKITPLRRPRPFPPRTGSPAGWAGTRFPAPQRRSPGPYSSGRDSRRR